MSADSLILLLKSFNLTTMAQIYDESLQRAEKENWGYRKFLQYLCENEFQARHGRKIKGCYLGQSFQKARHFLHWMKNCFRKNAAGCFRHCWMAVL